MAHPLVTPQGAPFRFHKETIEVKLSPYPSICFAGSCSAGLPYRLELVPTRHLARFSDAAARVAAISSALSSASGKAHSVVVVASPASSSDGEHCPTATAELTKFFNALLIDLQGVHLSFSSMDVSTHEEHSDTPGEPLIDLRLSVRMVSFPPLNMEF